MGRIRGEEGMIYNFYTEFANAEEFTKINRSAEWKDMCNWCLENGIRVGCFPVAIDDKIQAFFFHDKRSVKHTAVRSTSQEIPVAIDWGRIIDEVKAR